QRHVVPRPGQEQRRLPHEGRGGRQPGPRQALQGGRHQQGRQDQPHGIPQGDGQDRHAQRGRQGQQEHRRQVGQRRNEAEVGAAEATVSNRKKGGLRPAFFFAR